MSPSPRLALAALWLLLLPACRVGPDASALAPVRTGQGVEVVFSTRPGPTGRTYTNLRAELLEVRADALLLCSLQVPTERILLVPFRAITDARVQGLSWLHFSDGAGPSSAEFRAWRMLSRYPQGVNAALLRDLLAAYGQDSLKTLP